MSRSTPPNRRSSLVAGFVLNTLDELEAQEFGQLIDSDPTLLEDVAQLQQSLEQSFEIEEVSPPPLLRDRLLNSLSNQTVKTTIESPLPSKQLSRRRPSWLKATVAALAIALTLSNYLWWQSSRQQTAKLTELIARNSTDTTSNPVQTYTLNTTDAGTSGTVSVAVDPKTLTATLNASDLPRLAPDKVYVLWTVVTPEAPYTTDSKSAILTTTFTVDDQGTEQKSLSLPSVFEQPEEIAALGITIESAQAPQAHESAPVLLVAL